MSYEIFSDEYFMQLALKEAEKALKENEVPIGAIIVFKNKIIAKGYNQTEKLNDVTAHAEMLAITSALSSTGTKYLNECILYVTLEPCPMCAGAMYWSQIGKIVYGASDKKRGYSLFNSGILHPKTNVTGQILTNDCSKILTDFFKLKRK